MPVENERKYVLDISNEDHDKFIKTLLKIKGSTEHDIMQAYLNESTRIRSKFRRHARKETTDADREYYFTFKKDTGEEFGVVEIETAISHDDCKALYRVASGRIDKTRITVPHGDLKWEVDFFYGTKPYGSRHSCYLVMAEVELPDGVDLPDALPDFITDNMLYRVRRDDPRFFNSKLSNVESVLKLLGDVRNTVADAAETLALKDG